jgi:hypothetical protein
VAQKIPHRQGITLKTVITLITVTTLIIDTTQEKQKPTNGTNAFSCENFSDDMVYRPPQIIHYLAHQSSILGDSDTFFQHCNKVF